MSLTARLARRISQSGPMTMAEYMDACLHDPQFGYYATRPAIGSDGDFITAPVISQMFGELIGVWALAVWRQLGRPSSFNLIEMGPGDGALLGDILRVAKLDPDFLNAADLWLVETSQPLRERQQDRLSTTGKSPNWVERLDLASTGKPFILLANELLDCLSVRQFVRGDRGWSERVVGLQGESLCYGLVAAAEALIPLPLRASSAGSIVEVSASQQSLGALVGARILADGGAALFIDYGRDKPGLGDTLQALRRHQRVDPLHTAGSADLTVHADFPSFVEAARTAGAKATAIVPQACFLAALGLEARATALAKAHPKRTDRIAREVERLTGPDHMGQLFKVVALHSSSIIPPGF